MEAQLAERDAILKQSFEEKERHAREAEDMRQQLLDQQVTIQAEMARKAAEERRGMLESDSGQWVRMLLKASRAAGEANADFVYEVEEMERQRQETSNKMREQLAFITVLRNHLQKDVDQYLGIEEQRGERELSHEDQLSSKVLLEQMLLKMKNLREEMQTNGSMAEDVVTTLDNMAAAAEGQLERAKEAAEAAGTTTDEVADLEMFLELAAKDRAKAESADGRKGFVDPSMASALVELGDAISRSIQAELAQVESRLQAVETGKENVDEQARAGMEKRVAVLKKELFVLGDIASKTELPRILHGMSQVLQGVVLRLGKRMQMKEKNKDKTLKEKEAQLERTRAEAETLRNELVAENSELKAQKQGLLSENEQLRIDLDELQVVVGRHAAANKALEQQLSEMGEGGGVAVPLSLPGQGGSDVGLPTPAAASASGGGGGAAAAGAANPYGVDMAALSAELNLSAVTDETAKQEIAATAGKLAIVMTKLGETEGQLAQMTQRATALAAEKKHLEGGELSTLRMKAARLEAELQKHDAAAVASIAAASKPPPKPPPPPVPPASAADGGALTLASLGIQMPSGQVASTAKVVSLAKPTSGVSVARIATKSLAESLVANAAANAVRVVGASAHSPLPRKPPVPEKVTLSVPEGAEPGAELTVTAPSGQEVTMTVPEGAAAGQQLEIELPPPTPASEKVTLSVPEGAAPGSELTVTAPSGQQVTLTVPEGIEAGQQLEIEVPGAEPSGAETLVMQVPEGAAPGSQLTVTAPTGQQVTLTVPEGAAAGAQLEIELPAPVPSADSDTVVVTLPDGYTAGQELTVTAPSGQEVTLTVPEGAAAGAQLEVDVPTAAVAGAMKEEAMRALAARSEEMALQLAAKDQAASSLHSQIAQQSVTLQQQGQALAAGGGGGGAASTPVQSPGKERAAAAAAAEENKELTARVGRIQSELQAARKERKELERLKAASEQMVLDLKHEKLNLEEKALQAEEQALAAQEEVDGKDAEIMDLREAQMKAEVKAEQLMTRLQSTDERSGTLARQLDAMETKYKEAHEEVVTLEEEKYRMVDDVEVLEDELEEAHQATKRYFELVGERDAALSAAKEGLAAEKQRNQRLEYEKELAELRNNPVEEGGEDLGEVYAQIESQKSALASRDREIAKLRAELDRATTQTVDDEPSHRRSFGGGGGVATGEDSDDFGQVQAAAAAAQKREADEASRRSAQQKRNDVAAAEKLRLEAEGLRRRAETAEATANDMRGRLQQAERSAAAKEAEVLKLIQARDALASGQASTATEDREAELQDELYSLQQQLDEEQEKAQELEDELKQLRAGGGGQAREMQALRLELEDVREAKEKAESMLARAVGG